MLMPAKCGSSPRAKVGMRRSVRLSAPASIIGDWLRNAIGRRATVCVAKASFSSGTAQRWIRNSSVSARALVRASVVSAARRWRSQPKP